MSPSVCLCVCVFVCPRSYLRNYMSELHQFFVHFTCGRGSVAEWLTCWTQAQKGPGSNCEGNKIVRLKKIVSPQPAGGPSERKKIRGPWARAQCARWLIAKFHYTGPTGPDPRGPERTGTHFVGDPHGPTEFLGDPGPVGPV